MEYTRKTKPALPQPDPLQQTPAAGRGVGAETLGGRLLGSEVRLCGASSNSSLRPPGGGAEDGTKWDPVKWPPWWVLSRGASARGRKDLENMGDSISPSGPSEPKTSFITFCLSSPRMAGPLQIISLFKMQFKKELFFCSDPGFL